MKFLIKIIILVVFEIFYVNCDNELSKRVKLTDIQTLTLHKGVYTTGRRADPILQLQCVGGTAGCKYSPEVVQCYNRAIDDFNAQWECKANLDQNVKFGHLRINCEGYDYPADPYVLAGSCGLEYTLELKSQFNNPYFNDYYQTNRLGNFLTLILLVVIILSVYKTCTKLHPPRSEHLYMPTAQTDLNEYPGFDYSNYPAPPPPYAFMRLNQTEPLLSNENNQQQNTWPGGHDTNNNDIMSEQPQRCGYETPPPEYEEKDESKLSVGITTMTAFLPPPPSLPTATTTTETTTTTTTTQK